MPDDTPTQSGLVRYGTHDTYLPTPDEIRQQCAAIQAGWTEAEWREHEAIGAVPVDVLRYSESILHLPSRTT